VTALAVTRHGHPADLTAEGVRRMARDELITVHWHGDAETWTVDARPHGEADWVSYDGADGELAVLLGLAHDIATGG